MTLKVWFLATAAMVATPALAQQVSDQGAKDLAASLASTLGRQLVESGMLKVAPDGSAYRVTIDPAPALQRMKTPDFTLEVQPWSFRTAPNGDGRWTVSSDSFPAFSARGHGPTGDQVMSMASGSYRFEGIFDPALATFTTASGGAENVSFQANAPGSNIIARYGAITFEAAGKPSATGAGVDSRITETLSGFEETINGSAPGARAGVPSNLMLRSGVGSASFEATGLRSRELVDFYASLLQHQDSAALIEAQGDIKARLTALLPIWNSMAGSITIKDLQVDSAVGRFGAASLTEGVEMSGLTAQGRYGLTITLDGLAVPGALVPPWAASLVPRTVALNLAVQGIDLDGLARSAIESFDARATPPISAEGQARLAQIVLKGPPVISLTGTRIATDTLDLALQGDLRVSGAAQPVGQITIDAKGFDQTVASLQQAAASNPQIGQAMMPLALAKGLARPAPDGRLRWVIDARADGSVAVNGTLVKPAEGAAPGSSP